MLPFSLEFAPDRDAEIFALVPLRSGVFVLRGEAGEPYVSKTANLRRRLIRLLGPGEERSRRLTLRHHARRIEYALTGSDFEAAVLLYQLLRQEFPGTYKDRLRLRPAPLVKFHLDNPYPRASITTQLGSARGNNTCYGPFATRAAAEKFANDALDFFKMRRCVDDLSPDPAFPGCIYSEMKMCLAPCFKGCTDSEYAHEVSRVQSFFDTRGRSLERQLATERDRASEQLSFEEAAGLHAKIEKLKVLLGSLPEITRRVDQLNGLMIQPSAEADSVTLFRIDSGCLSAPLAFRVTRNTELGPRAAGGKNPGEASSPRHISMEARLTEILSSAAPSSASRAELGEHLAILKRWYFRTSKTGEIFFADDHGELPMRRVVRAIGRVFRGEKAAADLSESTGAYWINRGREAEIDSVSGANSPRPEKL